MAVSCGTVGESSLNPNAPHSFPMLILKLRELVQTLSHLLHQDLEQERVRLLQEMARWQQEMADLLDSGFFKHPVPKNRMRPLSIRSKYHEKPVQRVRPKCSPRSIIHQPR